MLDILQTDLFHYTKLYDLYGFNEAIIMKSECFILSHLMKQS